jgi:hypothetical protein
VRVRSAFGVDVDPTCGRGMTRKGAGRDDGIVSAHVLLIASASTGEARHLARRLMQDGWSAMVVS